MGQCPLVVTFTICILLCFKAALGIDCFECHSIDGSNPDCEDDFGPISDKNDKSHLLVRKCVVGYLRFQAHFCVKIKGTKPNGQSIVIRTCAFDDWGTVCGSVLFEHGTIETTQDDADKERIKGCLETCNYDGCNSALTVHGQAVLLLFTFMLHILL